MVGILDSGERREFENGFVRDMAQGKGRMDLLPWAAIMRLSMHCEQGAVKYGERNIDKAMESFKDQWNAIVDVFKSKPNGEKGE